jgi:hypothetical protein
MQDPQLGGEQHQDTRAILRVIGPVTALVGLAFTVVGVGNFFSSFGSFEFEPPRYFWCAFVGLPLLGVGVGICKFAFFGAVARYMVNEAAPVAKDAFNYMADGTTDGVRHIAKAVGEGIATGIGQRPAGTSALCRACNKSNDADAKFCKGCGAPLPAVKACAACGAKNDADARFCDGCGSAL